MKYLILVSLFISTASLAQSSLSPVSDSVYTEVDEMPEFPKGDGAFMREVVSKKIRYPNEARRMGVEGTVWISFVVEKDGTVTNVAVEQSLTKETDQEAARVISQSPKWNPGKMNGVPVRVKIKRSLKFKLAS